MIAKIIISANIEDKKKEIQLSLASHIGSGNVNNHPDLLYFSSETKLGIAEARKIKEHFSLKPYSAKGRAVVLENGSDLTIEAQNALLKTLEELPENALFIIGANSDSHFLPTVLSRCQIERLQFTVDSKQENHKEDITKLLEVSMEQRFEYIEKLKDREEFFYSLLNYFHQKLPANSEFVKELLQAEEWQKQNVNLRAILEYLMLVMPKK